MALAPGSRIGSYEITAQIGVGGMGEVYRATDANLARQVAIKVLPAAVAADAERLARFDREAKTLAALNHPNIAHVYGLERSEGQTALVMELVEGPTLADRVAQGPIAPDEALPIARQIAEALEAAHERGIVHRDLKPANVKVRADGTVKVLDFGLAKAMEPTGELSPGLSQSPTLTTPAHTMQGVILGTAAYMSPEQARGKPTDRRTDIWAFGCVLFEMLTGSRAFEGEDVADTLGNVMKVEPSWERVPASVPARVERVLRACLQKKATQRLDSAQDVRLALEGAFETTVAVEPTTAEPAPASWWSQPPWMAALVVLGVLAGLGAGWALWVAGRTEASKPVRRFAVALPEGQSLPRGADGLVAISRDGQTLVYRAVDVTGVSRLFQRRLAQLTATAIPGTEGANQAQFFSPDGESLAFYAGGTLWRTSLAGGTPTRIANLPSNPRGGSWGNGVVVVGLRGLGLARIADTGGDVELLTEGGVDDWYPQVLPGGRRVLFTAASGGDRDVRLLDLETREISTIVSDAVAGYYTPSGHVVYLRDGDLWAVTFDPDTMTVGERPALVEQGIRVEGGGAVQFAVADDGSLAYVPGTVAASDDFELAWVDAQGQEDALPVPSRGYRRPRVSPDGTRVVVEIVGDSGSSIWVADAVRGSVSRVTPEGADNQSPLWTPDGGYVVYASARDGATGFYRRLPDGTGEEEPLGTVAAGGLLVASSFSPDGEGLVFLKGNASGGLEGGVFSMEDGTWDPLALSDGVVLSPNVSPDGQWIAYASNESGNFEVYVQRFPDLGGRETISLGGGLDPVWSPDGRTIYYLRAIGGGGINAVMAVPFDPGPPRVIGTPRPAFDYQYYRPFNPLAYHDIAPDGRFVFVRLRNDASDEDPRGTGLTVVQNWFEELRRNVPTD